MLLPPREQVSIRKPNRRKRGRTKCEYLIRNRAKYEYKWHNVHSKVKHSGNKSNTEYEEKRFKFLCVRVPRNSLLLCDVFAPRIHMDLFLPPFVSPQSHTYTHTFAWSFALSTVFAIVHNHIIALLLSASKFKLVM